VNDGEIEVAIVVEIRKCQVIGIGGARTGGKWVPECAVSVTEQNYERCIAGVRIVLAEREVGVSIAVEIRGDHGEPAGREEGDGRLKRAIAVAGQQKQGAGNAKAARGGDGEIGLAIAVEIGNGDRGGGAAGREGLGGAERTVAVAGQHGDVIRPGVGNDEVGDAVAIHVGGGDGGGRSAHCVEDGRLGCAIGVLEVNGDLRLILSRDYGVGNAIPIEISEGEPVGGDSGRGVESCGCLRGCGGGSRLRPRWRGGETALICSSVLQVGFFDFVEDSVSELDRCGGFFEVSLSVRKAQREAFYYVVECINDLSVTILRAGGSGGKPEEKQEQESQAARFWVHCCVFGAGVRRCGEQCHPPGSFTQYTGLGCG
jgi:hypothetical protein